MALRWYTTVVDCRDIATQARWWAEVLDWQIIFENDHEAVIIPKDVPLDPLPHDKWTSIGPGIVFVPVPEAKRGKNRLHIDLAPHLDDDRDAMINDLIDKGASRVDVGQSADDTFDVLADPEGNEFCVLSARDR